MPKRGTRDFRKVTTLLKDAASKQKIEWVYVNRIVLTVLTFIVSVFMFYQLHRISVKYIYEEPDSDYDIIRSNVISN